MARKRSSICACRPLGVVFLACVAFAQGSLGADARWPQFRGPGGSGVAEETGVPVQFGPSANVLWKTALPAGHSSPVIWDDRIFVTGLEHGRLETLCLDRGDGRVLWRRVAPAERIEKTHATNSPASPTPTTDGHRVAVYFGSYGLLAYDLEGKELWRKPLPVPATDWGVGTSPVLAGGLVLLNRDQDAGAYLLAVDAGTGETVWKTPRPEFRRGFSTPLILHDAGQVVVAGSLRIVGYDLKTGSEKWTVRGIPYQVSPSPVFANGIVYFAAWDAGISAPPFGLSTLLFDQDKDGKLSSGEFPAIVRTEFPKFDRNKVGVVAKEEYEGFARFYSQSKNALLAIRPGGDGDVTETHVIWKASASLPHVPSVLVYRGLVYTVRNGGIVSCYDCKTGDRLVQKRLPATGNYYASPVASDGKVYFASERGVVVARAGKELEILATNDIGESIMATPAIVDNMLYLRGAEHLYAFGGAE